MKYCNGIILMGEIPTTIAVAINISAAPIQQHLIKYVSHLGITLGLFFWIADSLAIAKIVAKTPN